MHPKDQVPGNPLERPHKPFRPSRPADREVSLDKYFNGFGFVRPFAPGTKSQPKKTPPARDVGAPDTDKKKVTFRWMKGELVGRGSHGNVYMAFNATTGEVIAVKQVELPQTVSDKRKEETNKFIEALIDERDTLRDLDHANIVQYLGFEENPLTLNIFLEYVSGGTIGSCLKQYGPFCDEVTRHFSYQILEGLVYLHSKGIIHRDLKPDNVLVEESGVCKISDFGISKKLADYLGRAHTMLKGTSQYMAPEIVDSERAGRDGYDSKVDIWSMGCITMEMWTAQRPWQNEGLNNAFSIMLKLMERQAPPLPDDFEPTEAGREFLDACFTSDPTERPPAHVLQTYPYVQLPRDWTFPGMANMSTKRSRSTRDSFGNKYGYSATTFTKEDGGLTAVPQRASPPDNSVATITPRPITPPLVFIERPGPPKPKLFRGRSQSTSSHSSGSQKSSQSTYRKPPLMVYNPDEPEEVQRSAATSKSPSSQPYTYQPPSLPEIGSMSTSQPVPYSNQLAPLQPNRFVDPVVQSPPEQSSHSKPSGLRGLLSMPSKLSLRRVRSSGPGSATGSPISPSNETVVSDTASEFSTSSIWKKPPPDLKFRSSKSLSSQTNPRPVTQQATSSRHPLADTTGAPQISSVVGDTRPAISEVMERFKTFFPDHDLEQPVAESSAEGAGVPIPRLDTGTKIKSKAIADEQLGSPTRLWDSRIEEIRKPPK
ncbi:hypothetical protein D9613_001735 [Agrocybe pediades]|uniref:Protein kinase domain-containing protein n=1 Tax=Agrocybe pediades TaxID=84607 RepID=A0A8H4VWM6_9AGAR|nr:hypothetical protein D9613_001735 [Agrocybe pediades]